MRLIDADYIKASVKKQCDICRNEGMGYTANMVEKAIFEELDNAPTIDPVQHEHWTRKKMLNSITGIWKSVCMCSGCRHTQLTESAFCGGCGAKMDGDADE